MILYVVVFIILLVACVKYVNREPFKQKKKVVFLFSGNARSSPFTTELEKRSKLILDSYNKFIFTEDFKENYDYEVYITADNIHLQDTIQFFSDNHIKNIHLLDTDYYLSTKPNTKQVEYYLTKYNNKDWTKYDKYENSIHQHYKILDCYKLAKENHAIEHADYIVRIRLDAIIHKDITEVISMFNNKDLKIVIDWDFFALGTPDIMEWYCTGLENNYGNYNYKVPVPENLPVMHDYSVVDKKRWTYAAERQLFEMLYDYCHKHKLDVNKTIVNTSFCSIERK
jgi:hypothetical protein